MVETNQGFPTMPAPMVDIKTGMVLEAWRYFFFSLWNRTGQSSGVLDLQASLDALGGATGSMLIRGPFSWGGLSPGSQFRVLQMGVSLPGWNFLTGSNFGAQAVNRVLAGPPSGPSANPDFRFLVKADIPPLDPIPATVGVGLTAAGANQGNALAITANWNEVTTVAAGTGVRLDNASVGFELVVFNRGANALAIYPAVGSQINALGANAPFALAASGTAVLRPVTGAQLYAL